MNSDTVVRALGALAHESRLASFRALVVAGPEGLAAGDIAQQLGVSPSSLSFHLKDLSFAGLVSARSGRPLHLLLRELRCHDRADRIPDRELLRRRNVFGKRGIETLALNGTAVTPGNLFFKDHGD
jgi:DNA-binding transcriptional ArsR family regulator